MGDTDSDSLLRRLTQLVRAGQVPEALALANEVLAVTGGGSAHRRARHLLAQVYVAAGEERHARDEFEQTISDYRTAGDLTSAGYWECLIGSGSCSAVLGQQTDAWARWSLAAALLGAVPSGDPRRVEVEKLLQCLPDSPPQFPNPTLANLAGETLAHLAQLAVIARGSGFLEHGIALAREVAAHCQSDPAHARVHIRSLLELAEALTVRGGRSANRGKPGKEDFEEAERHVNDALEALARAGGASVLEGGGGAPHTARTEVRAYRGAVTVRSQEGASRDRYSEKAFVLKGAIALACGRPKDAFECHQRARELRRQWLTNASAFQGFATDDVVAALALGRWDCVDSALRSWVSEDTALLVRALAANNERLMLQYVTEFQPIYIASMGAAVAESAPESTRRLALDLVLKRKGIVAEVARLRRAARDPKADIDDLLRASADTVAVVLPEDTVLVEYVCVPRLHPQANLATGEPRHGASHYMAFLLSHDRARAVEVVDLGDASAIGAAVAEWLRHMFREEHTALSKSPILSPEDRELLEALDPTTHLALLSSSYSGSFLRQAVLDPILAKVGQSRLVLAPDGLVSLVPFHALPSPSERRSGTQPGQESEAARRTGWIVEDGPRIDYVSSGRDLLRKPPATKPGPAVIVVDPDYNLGAASPGRPFSRLASTRAEGKALASVLHVKPLHGAGARRRDVLSVASPVILHIATHAFAASKPPDPRDPLSALRHSGLALAGANAGGPEALLTAEDATQLALDGTRLVVLSACETGLGNIRIGEGVVGFRRAFLVAGARALVVSLWPVPDAQTKDLMIEFYSRLVARGETISDSLRAAQASLRKKHPHPFYWGAFIAIGDTSSTVALPVLKKATKGSPPTRKRSPRKGSGRKPKRPRSL